MRNRKALLIFLTCPGIGDFINFIPALRLAREQLPETKFLALVKSDSRYRDLVGFAPEIDRIFYIETKKDALLNKLRPGRILGLLRAFAATAAARPFAAVIINFKLTYCLWARLAGIPMRIGPVKKLGITHTTRKEGETHAYHFFYKLFEPAGVDLKGRSLSDYAKLTLPEETAAAGRRFIKERFEDKRKTAFICFGGTIPWNHWGYENYLELVNKLSRENVNILIVGGPYEADVFEKYGREVNSLPNAVWTSGLSFLELCGVIGACDLLVGGSTGPTHIANALGVPTLALFPEADLDWQPKGKSTVTICRKEAEDWQAKGEEEKKLGYARQIPFELTHQTAQALLDGSFDFSAHPQRMLHC